MFLFSIIYFSNYMSVSTTLCNKPITINDLAFIGKKLNINCTLDHNLFGIVPVTIAGAIIPYINGTYDFKVESKVGEITKLESVDQFEEVFVSTEVSIDTGSTTANISNLNYEIPDRKDSQFVPVSVGNTSIFDGASIQISNKVDEIESDDPLNIITEIITEDYIFHSEYKTTLKVLNSTANTNIIIYIGN